jgi:hypothetical protein
MKQTAPTPSDFRINFARLAPQAIVTRAELAALLSTSVGAISQMGWRGELPPTAFQSKRRAVWFAGEIRRWLDDLTDARGESRESHSRQGKMRITTPPRTGRPRNQD